MGIDQPSQGQQLSTDQQDRRDEDNGVESFDEALCEHLPRRLKAICLGTAEGVSAAEIASYREFFVARQVANDSSQRSDQQKRRRVRKLETSTNRPKRLECLARGEAIRKDVSNLCGMRGQAIEIHACAKYGECSLGRYCKAQTVRTCAACVFAGQHVPPPELPIIDLSLDPPTGMAPASA